MLAFEDERILFPDKIVQIFDEATQSRINCLPATLLDEKVCGGKWVSVFPENPKEGMQNLSAVLVLSEIEHGFPVAVMEGTLASNMRVGAVGAERVHLQCHPLSDPHLAFEVGDPGAHQHGGILRRGRRQLRHQRQQTHHLDSQCHQSSTSG